MGKVNIQHPCPMLIMRMKKDGDNMYCHSCKKEVVDWRNKEISNKISQSEEHCGIFYKSQINLTTSKSNYYKFAFFVLVLLSFFGFNVQPLNAHSSQLTDKINGVIQPSNTFDRGKKKEKDEKIKHRKRKKDQIIVGRYF